MRTLLVIGADAAGMSAAAQARRRSGPDELRIVAVDRGHWASYSACGIPYWIAGDLQSPDDLVARTPQEHREKHHIDLRLRTEAVGLDLDAQRATVRDLDAATVETIGFDELMIATGARPKRPPIEGLDAAGVYGVQTLDDGKSIRLALADDPRRAVVIGGGYIGLEMAEALVRRGLSVTVVHDGPQVMQLLDPEMGRRVGDAARHEGIRVVDNARVDAVETTDGRVSAVVTADETFPADLVILGLGVEPETTLASAAGIGCGPTGGVVVDRQQRSRSHPFVWSGGDCCELFHRLTRQPAAIALGTHAAKQGRVAGTNVTGGYVTFPGVIGTAVTKVCALEIGRTGLSSRQAERAGFEIVAVTTESSSRAGYMPGAERVIVRVIAERGSGRLLGGQIVGTDAAAKRIDSLATAIWNGMTAEQFALSDLSYAPPFSPVLDPVVIAARRTAEATDRQR